MMKWIKCSEKMPGENKLVMVFGPKVYYKIAYRLGSHWIENTEIDEKNYEYNEIDYWSYILKEPEHYEEKK